jgi:hypothetical protein
VFRNTILQSTVPDQLRGRLSAIQIAVVQGGPRLGDLEAGAVAEVAGLQFSVVSGGLACIVGAGLLALGLPGFRRQVVEPTPVEPTRAEPTAAEPTAVDTVPFAGGG